MKNSFFTLWLLLLPFSATAKSDIIFAPQEPPQHIYTGGWEHFVGGGVAAFDCNEDGRLDLFAAGGSAAPALWVNTSEQGGAIRFRALPPPEITATTGAYPIDINNDDILDLVVLRVGADVILKGQGDCRFTPLGDTPPFETLTFLDQWSTAFSARWEKDQAFPTLAFGHYVDRSDPEGPFEACDTNLMFRAGLNGYKREILAPGFCPLSILFSDWNRSGTADLRMSNDRHYYVNDGAEQLWKMTNPPRLYDESDGWISHKLWGMGIASRDIDRNGRIDVFMSSMGDQRLQEWTGEGAGFKDVPFDRGTSAHAPYTGADGRPSTGWHISFGDVQNDGLDDVFIAKGNVQQMPGMAMKDPNNLLIQQDNNNFVENGLAAGVASLHRARGAAMVDLNNDGLLDLVVLNRNAPLEVYRNDTASHFNWIMIEPRQVSQNTRAIGTWIELEDQRGTQWREVTLGGGHVGDVAAPQHFGLGGAEKVRLRIHWPHAPASDWIELDSNRSYQVFQNDTGLEARPISLN